MIDINALMCNIDKNAEQDLRIKSSRILPEDASG